MILFVVKLFILINQNLPLEKTDVGQLRHFTITNSPENIITYTKDCNKNDILP